MAVDKNIQIKKHNGVDFDSLFPKTKAILVALADGRTVQEVIDLLLAGDGEAGVSQADIDTAIAGLKGTPPTTLDTLQELATAINNDPAFNTTMTTALGTKVDKVAGKVLSTNDFTTPLLTKLNSLELVTVGTTAPANGVWYQVV